MKLVASIIARNERGRYLGLCVDHLLEFCDEVRLIDDASDDGAYGSTVFTDELLLGGKWNDGRFFVKRNSEPRFYAHEGRARQELLDWTLEGNPTHVLAIDADEFVDDGKALRALLSDGVLTMGLCMEEVWEAREDGYSIRMDGGWRAYSGVFVWKVDTGRNGKPRMADRQLACGRIPQNLQAGRNARPSNVSLLHFGWANRHERQARYDRYVEHDGGRFHADKHLQSILNPPEYVRLQECSAPEGLKDIWPVLVDRANKEGS